MCKECTTDLGFAKVELPIGSHICQIYSDDSERNDSLNKFLLAGIKAGERGACFSDVVTDELIDQYFKEENVSYSTEKEKGSVSLSKTSEVYFTGGKFVPENMLKLLTDFHVNAIKDGYAAARVIGEMSPEINNVPGGSRLLEYESRVSMLLREHPVTAVCQYNAHNFDGATIMDVLKVHPMMIVNGTVVNNPFYITPEEFLENNVN